MDWRLLLLLCLALKTCLALELSHSSRSPSTVIAGESAVLSCRADSEWRWCYWQDEEAGRRYQSFQGSPDSGTSDPSVRFSNGETNCDIVFDPVSPSAHSSTWKCHLADTDLEAGEQVKAEALIQLRVAQQAELTFTSSLPEDGSPVEEGQELEMSCEASSPEDGGGPLFPTPEVAVYQVMEGGEEVELASGELRVSFVKAVLKEDHGSEFYCRSVQRMPEEEEGDAAKRRRKRQVDEEEEEEEDNDVFGEEEEEEEDVGDGDYEDGEEEEEEKGEEVKHIDEHDELHKHDHLHDEEEEDSDVTTEAQVQEEEELEKEELEERQEPEEEVEASQDEVGATTETQEELEQMDVVEEEPAEEEEYEEYESDEEGEQEEEESYQKEMDLELRALAVEEEEVEQEPEEEEEEEPPPRFMSGEVLFDQSSKRTSPLSVSFAPYALAAGGDGGGGGDGVFVYEGDGNGTWSLEIPFAFAARPRPEKGLVRWTIEDGSDALPHFLNPGDFVVDLVDSEEDVWADQGDGEVVKVEGVKEPVLRYKAEELEEEEDAFVAVLQMKNITQNLTVTVEVSNGAGGEGGTKLGREFQIVYMPTRAEEVVAAEEIEVDEAGSSWLLVVIIIAVILLVVVLVVLIFCCATAKKRRRQLDKGYVDDDAEQEKEVKAGSRRMKFIRRSGNKSDRRVDLDAVNEGVMEQMDREMEIYTGGGRPALHRGDSANVDLSPNGRGRDEADAPRGTEATIIEESSPLLLASPPNNNDTDVGGGSSNSSPNPVPKPPRSPQIRQQQQPQQQQQQQQPEQKNNVPKDENRRPHPISYVDSAKQQQQQQQQQTPQQQQQKMQPVYSATAKVGQTPMPRAPIVREGTAKRTQYQREGGSRVGSRVNSRSPSPSPSPGGGQNNRTPEPYQVSTFRPSPVENDPLRQSANLNSPTVVYGGVAPAPRQQRHLQQQQQQPATIAYDDEEAPSYEFRRNTVLRLSGPTNYPILTQVNTAVPVAPEPQQQQQQQQQQLSVSSEQPQQLSRSGTLARSATPQMNFMIPDQLS